MLSNSATVIAVTVCDPLNVRCALSVGRSLFFGRQLTAYWTGRKNTKKIEGKRQHFYRIGQWLGYSRRQTPNLVSGGHQWHQQLKYCVASSSFCSSLFMFCCVVRFRRLLTDIPLDYYGQM
jgi:hypothetical protein